MPVFRTIAASVFALAMSVGALPGQAIVAPGGRTLFRGATLIRSLVDISDSSLQSTEQVQEIRRYTPAVAIVHGFARQWSLIVNQPFAVVERRLDEELHRDGGLADLRVLVQYDGLYSRNSPGGLTRLAVVGGVRLPTGAERFSSRAAEYSAGLVFQKQTGLKYVFTADAEYTLTTESGDGFDAGDRLRFDAVPGYFLLSRGGAGPEAGWLRRFYEGAFRNGAYLIVEFNGTWRQRARNQTRMLADSGGTTVFVSPGIQYFPAESLLVEFSRPIAVVKRLHGAQPIPGARYVVGFRYLF